jgi:formylglycine-generating enzyme
MSDKAIARDILAAVLTLTASFAQGGDHAPWPTDWNNWSDPALMVAVVNAGNPADSTGYGSVGYNYNIGKYEVTAGQYTAFLNAVADTDAYGLYSPNMWSTSNGCKIERTGSSGSYVYAVASDYANRPVNCVSWGDSARFANWLHNGQPTGEQGLSTTEDGAYYLNGATTNVALMAVRREADWKWAVTSEDEWYKASYYKGGSTSAGYWDYPTKSDTPPINTVLSTDPGNHANFYDYYHTGNNTYTIGSPYYRTEVGDFESSASAYDTFDQGGNVWEWNEALATTSSRGLRGGSFDYYSIDLLASYRTYYGPAGEDISVGFRVASVFEFLLGDANKDGTVNVVDLTALLNNYNKTGMVWENGDFTADHKVDVADLTELLNNYNQTYGAGVVSGTAVPEPNSLVLTGIALTALLYWWRKRA